LSFLGGNFSYRLTIVIVFGIAGVIHVMVVLLEKFPPKKDN